MCHHLTSFHGTIVSVNKTFLEKLSKHLYYTNIYEKSGFYKLEIFRIDDIRYAKKLFYKDSNIFLERKKKIFDSIIHN